MGLIMRDPRRSDDRRALTRMSDEYSAEFKKLERAISDAVSNCKVTVKEESGKAEKAYNILSGGIKSVSENIVRTESKMDAAIKIGDERLSDHDKSIIYHDRLLMEYAKEIERLKIDERNNRAEIMKLRKGLDGVIISVGQIDHTGKATNAAVSSMQINQNEGFNVVNRQFSTIGDSINLLRSDIKSGSIVSQKKWYEKLPLPAYGVITVAVLGVVIYFLTGDDTIVNLFKRGG